MEGEGYGVKHSKRGKDGSSELITKKLMKRYNFFFQAFMERLGLWGDGTAFKSFDTFLGSITKRGLGKNFLNFSVCYNNLPLLTYICLWD